MALLIDFAAFLGGLALIRFNSPLQTLAAFGLLGYAITSYLIPRLGPSFIKVGLKGRDMSKKKPVPEIPESMGLVVSITYIMLLVLIIPFIFFKYLVSFSALANDAAMLETFNLQYSSVKDTQLFPHNKLAEFLSALLCLLSTILLGLCDDLFDIRWRHKFFLPAIASLPLLIVYYVDFSVTAVVIPGFILKFSKAQSAVGLLDKVICHLNSLVTGLTGLKFTTLYSDCSVDSIAASKLLDLGIFYYGYMSALSIFCPNSINILAGINGLEVGQSIVLAVILLINDLCYLFTPLTSPAAKDSHLFSAILVIPLLGVSLGLYKYNRYPSKVFVGDTYCYFSGMVFAVIGILGHFSKTLLLFFLPQILNFLYSVPQLFRILPCPRHRLPRFDETSGKMYPSYGSLHPAQKTGWLVRILELIGLVHTKKDKEGNIVEFSNLTLINLVLVRFGPMREDHLCYSILALQFAMGALMLFLRHTFGPWLFGYDNLSWGVK